MAGKDDQIVLRPGTCKDLYGMGVCVEAPRWGHDMGEPRGAQGAECGVDRGRLSLGLPKAPPPPHITIIPHYRPETISRPEHHGQRGLGAEKAAFWRAGGART